MGCQEKEDGLPADVSSSRSVCYLSRAALITQVRAKQQLTKARSTVPTVLLTCMPLSISSSIVVLPFLADPASQLDFGIFLFCFGIKSN